MNTYLVTGGAGFIGSNCIHYLMEKYGSNIKVLNLDVLTYSGNRSNVEIYDSYGNYQFIHGNICDEELIKKIFNENDIDFVVHFAAQTHVDRSILSAKEFAETNVIGTLNLLNAAKDTWKITELGKKRFLYVSTDEVYGELPEEGCFSEKTPLKPRNPYSASKAAGDMMTQAFYETHHLPVLITRCSNNYGPYQHEEKLIPLLIKCCLSGTEIPVYGDGRNVRDWLYVTDHCDAIDNVLHNGRIGEVYNIGGHNEYTNIEVINKVSEVLHKEYGVEPSPLNYVEDRKGHDRRYAIDPSKIMTELEWKSKTAFEEGLRKTVHWYMEHKDFLNIF